VLEAMAAVNQGHQTAYGDDTETAKFQEVVKQLFGPKAVGYPVFNGTGANVVSLQAATKRWEAVICAQTAHIHADEGGAPEKMAGLKLWTIPTEDGKLTVEQIKTQVFDIGFVHRAQPGVISITQTTELGTVYTPQEIKAIADFAHENNLLLHLDGARLSNAAAALGVTFKAMTTDVGVDIISFGGTKIGALAAEAVVVTNSDSEVGSALAEALPYLRKTSMQLASKMRFISAQLNALFGNSAKLALSNAINANTLALQLYAGCVRLAAEFPQIQVPNETQANAVFPIFPAEITDALQDEFHFYVWNQATGQVRLMLSWDSTQEDVNAFLELLESNLRGM
jgi:threonine aldolase